MKYDLMGLACYPKSWRGTVVSPTKICIQFNNADLMLRPLDGDLKMLPKQALTLRHYIEINTSEKDQSIGVLAVGCQMPEIEGLQHELIQAYEKYAKNYLDVYTSTYNKTFKDFIKLTKAAIDRLDNILDKE